MSGLGLGDDTLIQAFISAVALVVVVAAIVFVYFGVARASGLWPEERSRRFRGYRTFQLRNSASPDLKDVGQQLQAVMVATFQRRRLLSSSKYRAFKVIEDEMVAMRNGYRVFAQTSLGEILASPSSDAFHSINSKRVDILIVDRGGWPVVAFEYQGNGHYQGTAAGRDAVKREALRKAGVRYVEISPSDSNDQIRSRVREQLGANSSASAA